MKSNPEAKEFRRRKGSLQSKFILYLGLVLAAFLSFFLYYGFSSSFKISIQQVEERAYAIINEISFSFDVLTRQNDPFSIKRLIEQTVTIKGVTEVGITDREGRFLFHSKPEMVGSIFQYPGHDQTLLGDSRHTHYAKDEFLVFEPLHGESYLPAFRNDVIGAIIIKMDLRQIRRGLNRMYFTTTAVTVFFILLFGLSVFFVIRRLVLKPIAELEVATHKIAGGDWSFRIRSGRRDEIAELGHAFNAMASALEEREHILTEQREELRQSHQELEKRVLARTAELSRAKEQLEHELSERKKLESRLLQAQKMEAVGVLAGGIAHDFNNIMQVISGYSQCLLKEADENSPENKYLKQILDAVQKAGQLTQQLLIFSRRVESRLEPLDVNRKVAEVCKMLERIIPKMIHIEQVLREDVKHIDADPVQVEQILMNLALNARDAMPEGGRLIIETEMVLLDEGYLHRHPGILLGEYVLLSVSDTGRGIEKEALKYIFDPFFTTKEIGRGTGLGLAMVYGIVENHGGHISCYSEVGKGTTFRIYFPVSGAVDRQQVRRRSREWAVRGGSETILVVDDEKDILEQEQIMLSEYGYKVLTAESGEDALKLFSENPAELVILDLIMPGMGGSRCLQELLKLDPEARVIIASGYSSEMVPEEVLEGGARAIINKPFLWEDLLGKVRELLDAGRAPTGRW